MLFLTRRSMIQFELIFVKGVRSVPRLIFFIFRCPVFPALFVEKAIFAPLYWFVFAFCICTIALTKFIWVYFRTLF